MWPEKNDHRLDAVCEWYCVCCSSRNLLGHREEGGWSMEPRPWSSTDSSGYGTDSSAKQRGSMTKASSFHSVTLLSRTDHIGGSIGTVGKQSKTGECSMSNFTGRRYLGCSDLCSNDWS